MQLTQISRLSALTAGMLVATLALSACGKKEPAATEMPATAPAATTAEQATTPSTAVAVDVSQLTGRWELCVDQASEVYDFANATDPNYQLQIAMAESREYAGANCTGEFNAIQLDQAAQQMAGLMLARVDQVVDNATLADYQLMEVAMQNIDSTDTKLGWILDKANNQLIQTDLTVAQLQALTADELSNIQANSMGNIYRRVQN